MRNRLLTAALAVTITPLDLAARVCRWATTEPACRWANETHEGEL